MAWSRFSSDLLVKSALLLVLMCLGASPCFAESTEIYDLIFTGCPPYVEGDYCDSIIYQVAAYDPDTGGVYQGVHYFLVEGRGEIDELTGIYKYKPYLDDDPVDYFNVEIGAELHGDTIPGAYNCRFDVLIGYSVPSLESARGAHLSVLPFDTARIPIGIMSNSPCIADHVVEVSVTPEPRGMLWVDEETDELVFVPGFYDAMNAFDVDVTYGWMGHTRTSDFHFDVFAYDPIALSIDTEYEKVAGDTVTLDLTLDECPIELGRMQLFFTYDPDLLYLVDLTPGEAFVGEDGCGWYALTTRKAAITHDPEENIICLVRGQVRAGNDVEPGCFTPPELPAVLARMRFVVNDVGQADADVFAPLRFYFLHPSQDYVCDSSLQNYYLPRTVFSHNGTLMEPGGVPGYAFTSEADFLANGAGVSRYRTVELHNGGVHIKSTPAPAPYQVSIGIKHNQMQGVYMDVPITLEAIDDTLGLTGFDFVVAYDNSALSFQQALEGDIYGECGWEFFTYRFGPDGNCGAGCPSGITRIIGIAETNNGSHHPNPDCQVSNPGYVDNVPVTLTSLRFLVSNDRLLECQWAPIRFFWMDCGDNTLSGMDWGGLYVSDNVYEADNGNPITDTNASFPSYQGANESCLDQIIENRRPYRVVDFHNGGVDIICPDDIDATGDVNLNGIAYEIADALLFQACFVYGLSVFTHVGGSIAASDVNGNGIPLELTDFAYLVQVIVGNALPHPPLDTADAFAWFNVLPSGSVELWSDDSLSTALLTFSGEVKVTEPPTEVPYMLAFDSVRNRTRLLLSSLDAGRLLKQGPVLRVEGSGVLTEVEATSSDARPIRASVGSPTDMQEEGDLLPDQYALSQNYPNPFNPSTTIDYALPAAEQVSIRVYNISGQRVKTLVSGVMPAGYHTVVWDGTNESGEEVGSGIYFYRIDAGDFVQAKKMLMLK